MDKNILLFSHDPGGANTIFPLIQPLRERGYKTLLFGNGPALKKYSEFGLEGINISSQINKINLPNTIKFLKRSFPDFIITGTSLKDHTERYLWATSAQLKIPSFAIIDSWMNYKIRFLNPGFSQRDPRSEKLFLPTKICIMDEFSKMEAVKDGLEENKLIITGQPYFQFLSKQKNKITNRKDLLRKAIAIKPSTLLITFISEPILETYKMVFNPSKNHLGYTEKTILHHLYLAIKGFVQKVKKVNIALIIKLHPREKSNNYEDLLNKFDQDPKIQVIVLKKQKLSNWELISCSDLVCGMASMLLVEAFLLGKPILSVQIGLKKDSPFILDKLNIVKSIIEEKQLFGALEEAIANRDKPKYNFKVITNPIENVISAMEDILCQN